MIKYIEVYEDLKKKIVEKEYNPWAPMEGEMLLSNKYGVSRPTIRKAIAKLKKDGFIHSRQGSGIFVNPPEFYEEVALRTLSEKYHGNHLKTKVIIFKKILSNKELEELFSVSPDSIFYYFKRVRIVNSQAKIIEETYMPEYLFKNFDKDIVEKSIIKYIEEQCKYTISHDSKEVRGIMLSKEDAKELEKEVGDIALEICHKVYLNKSILAQYTKEIKADNFFRTVSVR